MGNQSHYYLALYRFKAIEKDDLDFQWVYQYISLNCMNDVLCSTFQSCGNVKHLIKIYKPLCLSVLVIESL